MEPTPVFPALGMTAARTDQNLKTFLLFKQ